MQTPGKISVIVPVYNGSEFLETCVENLRKYFSSHALPYELIIAEDGSTDGTKRLCHELKARYPEIMLLQGPDRLGRGASLARAIRSSGGDIVLYTDVDMATDLSHLTELVTEVSNGADIVTGSRYLPQSEAERSPLRLVSSLVYNDLVRMVLDSELSDHQCGFKAFKRNAIIDLLPQVRASHWFWDTEILVRAQERGYKVEEIPVKWQEDHKGRSTVNLAKDAFHFLGEVVRLRGELRSN